MRFGHGEPPDKWDRNCFGATENPLIIHARVCICAGQRVFLRISGIKRHKKTGGYSRPIAAPSLGRNRTLGGGGAESGPTYSFYPNPPGQKVPLTWCYIVYIYI